MTIRTLMGASLAAGALLLGAGAASADIKAGVDAWSRGDFARAIAEWKGPAERGDADAQFNLAQAYKLGRGVPVDLAKAEELFGKAAGKGHLQAADNLGLLLFQRGERARALPYIQAASDRGDPRSQYLLGVAHFNGDIVAKDWVRAYALVSLAQQAGLAQAAPALAQMDGYIPIEQRQQSAALASRLASAAQATRDRQLAAADLGASVTAPDKTPEALTVEKAVATAARAAGTDGPATAGADYARPPAPVKPAAAGAKPAPAKTPAPAPATTGPWRVQLGAFGVSSNAEALWNRVKSRPELAGRSKLLVPAGRIAKLQASGFATQAEAQAACSRLSAAGFACLAVRD